MLVAHGELVAAFCTTCVQYALAVFRLHASAKTMLIFTLPLTRLKCALHLILDLISRTGDAKLRKVCADANWNRRYLEKDVEKSFCLRFLDHYHSSPSTSSSMPK